MKPLIEGGDKKLKLTFFKNSKISCIFEVNLEPIVKTVLSLVTILSKFDLKKSFLEVIIVPIFISSNAFFYFNSEIQNQNIKKESLQYEFCLPTETYCMIQNENR